MIHNHRLAPLGPMRPRLLSAVANSSIQQQEVDLILTKILEHLLRKRLDALEVVEL